METPITSTGTVCVRSGEGYARSTARMRRSRHDSNDLQSKKDTLMIGAPSVTRGRSRTQDEDSPLKRWLYLAPAAMAAAVIVRWDLIFGPF